MTNAYWILEPKDNLLHACCSNYMQQEYSLAIMTSASSLIPSNVTSRWRNWKQTHMHNQEDGCLSATRPRCCPCQNTYDKLNLDFMVPLKGTYLASARKVLTPNTGVLKGKYTELVSILRLHLPCLSATVMVGKRCFWMNFFLDNVVLTIHVLLTLIRTMIQVTS